MPTPPRELTHPQRALVEGACRAPARAAGLFARLLRTRGNPAPLARRLTELAGPQSGAAWRDRRLYALMLEHLAIRGEGGASLPGLRELDVARGPAELARYLHRNRPTHRHLIESPRSILALERFLDLARQDCRVLLARHFFTPAEVVARFVATVRPSEGVPSPFLVRDERAVAEAERVLEALPGYEREIVQGLLERREVFWAPVDPDRSLNSLVEYPEGTVVLVLKPPGSSLEIEFKRAGYPTRNPLRVAFGEGVPSHHRLDGGGYGLALRWEARAAAWARHAYREAHGEELTASVPVSILSVHAIPAGRKTFHTLRYFGDPEVLGPDHASVRRNLQAGVCAAKREGGWRLEDATDDLGIVNEFLIVTKPAQGVFVGSTSFRVDRVAGYLTAPGAAHPLASTGSADGPAKRRRLVDTLLSEALGHYEPPRSDPSGIGAYARAALALEANRAEADRAYLSLVGQAAGYWGTLLAWGAGSRGESFVARNVGLRAHWSGDGWVVRLVFMDHDQLTFAPESRAEFRPLDALPAMEGDADFLAWRRPRQSLLTLLRSIYRPSPTVRRRGRARFRDALSVAYRATRRRQLLTRAGTTHRATFIDSLVRWDAVVALALDARERRLGDWRRSVRRSCCRLGLATAPLGDDLLAFEHHHVFLRRYRYLFRAEAARWDQATGHLAPNGRSRAAW